MDTKVCTKCNELLPVTNFYVHKKTGIYAACKECHCKQTRGYYAADRARHQALVKSLKKKKSLIKRDWLRGYKTSNGCVDCGERHPACLDFDHTSRQPGDKNIGHMVYDGHSLGAVKREAAKCEVRCSNCHRKRHWEERETGFRDLYPEIDRERFNLIQQGRRSRTQLTNDQAN